MISFYRTKILPDMERYLRESDNPIQIQIGLHRYVNCKAAFRASTEDVSAVKHSFLYIPDSYPSSYSSGDWGVIITMCNVSTPTFIHYHVCSTE